MFGEKLFSGVGFPTPVSIPEETSCLILDVPANAEWWALVTGLLYELTLDWNWRQYEGALDRDAAAAAWSLMLDAALQRATITNSCLTSVPAPYWDLPSRADDDMSVGSQIWYGRIEVELAALAEGDITFIQQIGIWGITGFIAYSGAIGGAIAFHTFAPRFVLAWNKSGVGGAIRVLIDGVDHGLFDTYDEAGGVLEQEFYADEELEEHDILQILETKPEGAPDNPTSAEDAAIQVIRKRLSEVEVDVITDIRQEAGSGQLEMMRAGEWLPVLTAVNVRVDGTVAMTDRLHIDTQQDNALELNRFADEQAGIRFDNSVSAGWQLYLAALSHHLVAKSDLTARLPLDIDPATIGQILYSTTDIALVTDRTVDNAVGNAAIFQRKGGASPAAGYGVQLQWRANNASPAVAGVYNLLMTMNALWDVADEATRRSRVTWRTFDRTVGRVVLDMGTIDTRGTISVLGATPIPRQTISGERQQNAALASLLTAMAAFGFITDSTTAGTLPVGPEGPQGIQGEPGEDGADGAPGTPAETPISDLPTHGSIPPGECVEYDLILNAQGQLILPVVLQAGYTIQISQLAGAASDQDIDIDDAFPFFGFPRWYCPNGLLYVLGGCAGNSPTDAGDPLPTAPHMCLLASVNGALFDCSAEPLLEVGAGVYDVLCVFQLNDAALSDNQGQATFHVEICNPDVSGLWCHKFNFLTNDGGFSSQGSPDGAMWVSGTGWTNDVSDDGYNYVYIAQVFDLVGGAAITKVVVEGEYTDLDGTFPFRVLPWVPTHVSPGASPFSYEIDLSGAPHTADGGFELQMNGERFDTGAVVTFTAVTLYGTGENPFGATNCEAD